MPYITITRAITVQASPVASVHYRKGYTGLAPEAHVAIIVAAGAGERLSERGEDPEAAAARVRKGRKPGPRADG